MKGEMEGRDGRERWEIWKGEMDGMKREEREDNMS